MKVILYNLVHNLMRGHLEISWMWHRWNLYVLKHTLVFANELVMKKFGIWNHQWSTIGRILIFYIHNLGVSIITFYTTVYNEVVIFCITSCIFFILIVQLNKVCVLKCWKSSVYSSIHKNFCAYYKSIHKGINWKTVRTQAARWIRAHSRS